MNPGGAIPRVVVIGGGITGLAAAYQLTEAARRRSLSLDLRLLEATDRVGGVIRTEAKGGFLLESGPDSFITEKPWALELAKSLGLEDRLIGTNPSHRQAFIALKGALQPIPEGFYLISPSLIWPFLTSPVFSWTGKLRMGLELFIPARETDEDESMGAFVERRFGREAVDRMAQPMVGGIYTADVRKLSLLATMPQFRQMEKKYGSLIRALRARQKQRAKQSRHSGHPSGARYDIFVSPDKGMQVLVEALRAKLPPESVVFNAPVQWLQRDSAKNTWVVRYGDGLSIAIEADAVCLAVPAHQAARILESTLPELSGELLAIPHQSTATANLIYDRKDVPHALNGFGFVVPPSEGRSILACTFSSVKFAGRAPEGKVVLRAFLGGALQPEMVELNDEQMERAIREDLRLLLGIQAAPSEVRIRRHLNAMPLYPVGHLDRLARIEGLLGRATGLALAGNAYHGVGVPDCIHSAQQAAETLLGQLYPS